MAKVHLIIKGKVQGVFFRAETKRISDTLNLSGWVKNLPSGEVEIYATGFKKDLEKLIEWCHQGPSLAKVSQVKTAWNKNLGDFSSFEIIR